MSPLPEALAPRDEERAGTGEVRLVETTLLLLVFVLLAIATINDLVRQSHVNHRLIADLRTWRDYTGHGYHNLSIEQEITESPRHREVVCGNTSPGPPKARTQLCLVIGGPQRAGRRGVRGGWYLPAKAEDLRAQRYGCFGTEGEGECPR
jgi:hypothetical protein